jgi:hypothetical protein
LFNYRSQLLRLLICQLQFSAQLGHLQLQHQQADEQARHNAEVYAIQAQQAHSAFLLDKATPAIQSMADAATSAANAMNWLSGGASGSSRGAGGGWGSSSGFTVYGPKVDPLGSPYYDSDSYNGIGHIDGRAFNLNSEAANIPTAMKDPYAHSTYPGLQPGGWYKSKKDARCTDGWIPVGARTPIMRMCIRVRKRLRYTFISTSKLWILPVLANTQ